MTFEEFQATGRDVADLRDAVNSGGCDYWECAQPGRVYVGDCWIETNHASGATLYSLTLCNEVFEATADLERLERALYEWIASEFGEVQP